MSLATTLVTALVVRGESPRFDEIARRYLDEFPALSPIGATSLGDHRFDRLVDDISDASRQRERQFYQRYLAELEELDRSQLSRDQQVDYQLLVHQLRGDLWRLEVLQEWAWNPIAYTQLAGGAIYSLLAREFAALDTRLAHAADRLVHLPRLYEQVRATLQPPRVPRIHAETAIKQNRGVISIIDNLVRPHVGLLPADRQRPLLDAIQRAEQAVEQHQVWLEQELLPKAKASATLGQKLYDEKLAYTLGSGLTRGEIRQRAEGELLRVRREMYAIARRLQGTTPELPEEPSADEQQRAIVAALEQAYADVPARDGVVQAAQRSLELTTAFVRQKQLITLPDDPLQIIEMPEFQRGVTVAYCDSPGPLDVGQKTFYAVAPLPADWTDEQCASYLREYNLRSIHNLTIHEAMPGHFVQLAHANRSPNRLRALLASGTFVEGWGVYAEQLMSEQGFLDADPLMRLITLKWYLRGVANALLDQQVHVDGIAREDAMRLMTEQTFQEEREAAGKWIRAQVTAAQLSTYFVGFQEHRDLLAAVRQAWGDQFTLKQYHDGILAYGSPPTRFVRAMLLDEPIPDPMATLR